MELFLHFADSEVATVAFENGNIRISFSAAHILRNNSEIQGDSTEGFSRHVELTLSAANLDQASTEFMGRISSGRLFADMNWSPKVALPCTAPGPIKLELAFANQSYLEIEASKLECRFAGEPSFFESMAC